MLDLGLEADPLAEELHRQIIRCQAALGRRAEALSAYHRCRKTLAIQLGIDPAPETETLHRALRDNRPLPP
jgi:DNA-binding SARP family transcriptional activator